MSFLFLYQPTIILGWLGYYSLPFSVPPILIGGKEKRKRDRDLGPWGK
jgi:hypothetical protein